MKITDLQKKIISIALLVVIVFTLVQVAPKRADAVWPVLLDEDASVTGIMDNITQIMGELKSFVLDHLATMVAKQILQKMTSDVVGWINSGFKGSPAFMTNPGNFMMDVADQVTGAFIDDVGGPLADLCDPFSIDIQASLRLGMAGDAPGSGRYDCTLSTIINNVSNIPNNITINGASMKGFINGDFSQGGLSAFITMSTEQQDNALGAYLAASDDLQQRIEARKNTIKIDVSAGGGFMSFEQCDPVPDGEWYYSKELGDETKSVGSPVNKDCHTETPGSVISGTLQKELNVPADELELADSINSVINALMNQLISSVLKQGLGAMSSNTSSYSTTHGKTFTQDLSDQAPSTAGVAVTVGGMTIPLEDAVNAFQQTAAAATSGEALFQTASDCFADKLTIPNLTSGDIAYLRGKKSSADAQVRSMNTLLTQINGKEAIDQQKLDQQRQEASSTTQNLATTTDQSTGGTDLGQLTTDGQGLIDQSVLKASTVSTNFHANTVARNNATEYASSTIIDINQRDSQAQQLQADCNNFVPTNYTNQVPTP